MNPNQPNSGGGAPNEGAAGGGGKKRNKRNKNASGQQNASNNQQPKSHTDVEQKSQGQIPKQLKSGNDFPQISLLTITPQNKSDNKQQSTQKQNQSMDLTPPKAKQSKGGAPPATITNIDCAPTPGMSSNKQKQPTQKQNQPKETTPSKAAKQPKGEVTAPKPEQKLESNTNSQQIEQQIEKLKNKLFIPKRKNLNAGGTVGRKTEVDVNHLPLNLDKLCKKVVYHIDVQFTPELPKRLLRNALEEFNRKHYPNIQFAFDGRRNMYTTKQLKSVTDLVSIINEENNKTIDYTIVTSVVNTIQMSQINDYLKNGSSNCPPGEAFQALDIILKNRPFGLRFINFGRSFFPVPRNIPIDLGEGMELWKGFFQSPVMGWKPFLNIDVAHKGFPKFQSLVDYIKFDLAWNPNIELDYRALQTLLAYVKGLKVDFMVPNQLNTKRSYKVVGLLDSASKFYFEFEDPNKRKQNINVLNYFKVTRNYDIKFPRLPCLHVGNIAKKTAIPIELCMVQRGQLRLKKLTETQTANMVRNAARPPSDRRQTIENCIRDINYNRDPVLKEFGIEVTEKFASIPARVLEQPSLAYAQNRETKPKAGVWRPDKFSKSAIIQNWVVLNLDCMRTKPQSLKDLEKHLISSGREFNVDVKAMNPIINCEFPRHHKISDIQKDITKKFFTLKDKVSLIVVVIPDYPPGLYAAVKQSSELIVGVLTQCIKSKTVYKMNPSTANNIMLKINSKLNGINHTLALKSSPPCMARAIIFGADVTHPSPDQTSIPSVAAVAASHDLRGSQYNMEWRLQSPKVEIIQDLEDIVHKQLCRFKSMTNTLLPEKIFYFRDGVSEGQFLQLLDSELISIRRACLRLSVSYKPAVTFLVVQKRHHTRIFPKFPADMDGKFANVPSGTIIDTHITHPTELDFYLCSHASIQGTSRPTKYHLIWDDNNLSDNELEQLTFYLCFMFVRCTRSVSYPAPTYYAHLAAFRARAYIENKAINLDRLSDEQKSIELNPAFVNNTPMFFV